MTDIIPVFKPSLSDDEIEAVTRVLKSGWWGLGPETALFEKEFKEFAGSAYAVGAITGTAALHLAMVLLDLAEGDEVIVPTITFVSTAHVVKYCGGRPVFADVLPDTLCIDPEDVRRKITPRTKAIIPVHYGGHPCDMDELGVIAEETGITIIEDAAHACGAAYRGTKVGGISNLTCFSFHAVKNLACGEGGMITGLDTEHEERLRRLRWMGITKDTFAREGKKGVYDWYYEVLDMGHKAHLSDIPSALGRVQLRRLDENNGRRRAVVERYQEAFADLQWLELPPEKPEVSSSWHIFHLKLDSRDKLIRHLKDLQISPGVHYYPIHLHPYYKSEQASCPVAEGIWKKIITLPLFPDMTNQQIDRVIDAVISFSKF